MTDEKDREEVTLRLRGALRLRDAIETYHARKTRLEHPRGFFDSAKRWYPAPEERRDCCFGIRQPTRQYPYSLMTHCRTIAHIAELFDVDKNELRSAVTGKDYGPTLRFPDVSNS